MRQVLSAPTRRESYGRLLNLPRFGAVEPGKIYRSAKPETDMHSAHLARLGIRTFICVRGGGPSPSTEQVARNHGIGLRAFELGPDDDYDMLALRAAVRAALDPANQPVLIH